MPTSRAILSLRIIAHVTKHWRATFWGRQGSACCWQNPRELRWVWGPWAQLFWSRKVVDGKVEAAWASFSLLRLLILFCPARLTGPQNSRPDQSKHNLPSAGQNKKPPAETPPPGARALVAPGFSPALFPQKLWEDVSKRRRTFTGMMLVGCWIDDRAVYGETTW